MCARRSWFCACAGTRPSVWGAQRIGGCGEGTAGSVVREDRAGVCQSLVADGVGKRGAMGGCGARGAVTRSQSAGLPARGMHGALAFHGDVSVLLALLQFTCCVALCGVPDAFLSLVARRVLSTGRRCACWGTRCLRGSCRWARPGCLATNCFPWAQLAATGRVCGYGCSVLFGRGRGGRVVLPACRE